MRGKRRFPSGLDGRLDALLNGINTELKTVTMLHLGDLPAPLNVIIERIRGTVGERQYLPSRITFRGYLNNSLVPNGLASREVEDEIKFALTNAGRMYGVLAAALALKWAVDNDMSMYTCLGCSWSPTESRSPLNRIQILESLYPDKKLRAADIADVTQLSERHVSFLAADLQDACLLSYDSENAPLRCRWTRDVVVENLVGISYSRSCTMKAAQLMMELNETDSAELGRKLGITSRGKMSELVTDIVNQGAAAYVRWDGQHKTETQLTQLGRRFVEMFSRQLLLLLQDDKQAFEVVSRACCVIGDREYTRSGIELYRAVSPGINMRERADTNGLILSYLCQNPGSKPADIADALGLQRRTTAQYLAELSAAGVLKVFVSMDDKRILRYFPA